MNEVETVGRWCEQCDRTVIPVCESKLIQGHVHDWVEDVEKCPVCHKTLKKSTVRTDRLRRMQRW